MPDHTPAPGGVFLSYAREDTDAARRIADALRAFGVEVWFDQSELRGGDAWDAKLKKQIRECTLFVPIVSAGTQARGEGYFRREWKLAVERTHDMAAGLAFIVPVVIDDTPESSALVPDEFMRYQWTRLPNGVPTPHFVEQVKRLLGGKALEAGRPRPALAQRRETAAPPPKKSVPPVALWLSLGAVAVSVGVVFFVTGRREPAAPARAAETGKPAASVAAIPPVQAPAGGKSVAVLPFANLSADKDNEFFADGMHDDLITALAKIRDLKVISRTSVMPYKTGERNLRKIAAELGVATVLEGSVQRAGNRVRLNVQLIDAQTDGHLWAETYSKDLTDVFALQAALTQEIAAALKANLTAGERILIERRPTENQQAYDLYLRARILDQTLQIFSSKEEYERVVTLYQQAADLDPGFTLAHVQASISHGTMFWFAALDPTQGRRALAQAALEKARALAPGSPEVRLAQGSFAYACNNDWQGALDEYRAAEAGLPNDAQLQYRMALALRRLGDYGEALARLERCATLNPSDTRGISTLIETLMGLRRYRPVLAAFDRYRPLFAEDYQIARYRLLAQSELTGDWPAFLRGVANLPPRASDRFGLDAAYSLALYQGKLAEAERILLDPRLQTVPGLGGTVNEPVALHRAQLAWLSGQPDAAARFADEAIADYRGRTWSVRQQPAVQLGIARAEALAGRTEAALREGRAALAAQEKLDRWSYPYIRHGLGQVMIITGRTEEALENLRVIMDGFGLMTAAEFRHDPIWARLKSDPRFEVILKSAKPL